MYRPPRRIVRFLSTIWLSVFCFLFEISNAFNTPSPRISSSTLSFLSQNYRKESAFTLNNTPTACTRTSLLFLSSSSDDSTKSQQQQNNENDTEETTTPFTYEMSEEDTAKIAAATKNGKTTLYDVLRASPTSTKSELKRQYLKMARDTHPDAMIGRSPEEIVSLKEANLPDFAEVATAWEILSDPKQRKRYDRTLRAEEFTDAVEKMADNMSKKAAPTARRVIENMAMPFLVRTATTTIASVTAASEELSKKSKEKKGGRVGNIGSAVGAAIKAGKNAGRVIDRMELLEKSQELEQRANEATRRVMELRAELQPYINKRLELSINTPNAGISSSEAVKILDGFEETTPKEDPAAAAANAPMDMNNIDNINNIAMIEAGTTATIGGGALSNDPQLEYGIRALEDAEREYFNCFAQKEEADQKRQASTEFLTRAVQEAESALAAEIEARRALEDAQRRVIMSRNLLSEAKVEFSLADEEQKRWTIQLDKYSNTLTDRQERVRQALARKQKMKQLKQSQPQQPQQPPPQQQQQQQQQRRQAAQPNTPYQSSNFNNNNNSNNNNRNNNKRVMNTNENVEENKVDNASVLTEIEALLSMERYITNECDMLEEQAEGLRTRAKELRAQSEGLVEGLGDDNSVGGQ